MQKYTLKNSSLGSSILRKKSFLIFLLFLFCSCSTTNNTFSYKDGLLISRQLSEQFGEYMGDISYLNYIKVRLLAKIPNTNTTHYNFIVLNTDQNLAFSATGGFILLSKGLIKRCHNEAELAFIIAHEIAHHYLGHTRQQEYTQDLELEADNLALAIIVAAGYDPYFSIKALNNMYYYIPATQNITHPPLKARLTNMDKTLSSINWRPPGTVNRRAFNLFLTKLS